MIEADDARPLDLIIVNAGVSSNTIGDSDGDTARLIAEININGTMNTVAPLIDRLDAARARSPS